MPQERREPPGGYRRPSGCVAVAASFDTFRDNNTRSKRQGSLRRTLGPGERAVIRAYRQNWPRLRVIEGGGP